MHTDAHSGGDGGEGNAHYAELGIFEDEVNVHLENQSDTENEAIFEIAAQTSTQTRVMRGKWSCVALETE